MSKTDDKGISNREHYEQVAAATGSLPKEAEGPPFPDVVSYLWEIFIELHQARPTGGMGPGLITFEGIRSWCELTGTRLQAWEIRAIKQIDLAWMDVNNG